MPFNEFNERSGGEEARIRADNKRAKEIFELKKEIETLKETCMGMCKKLEDATKHEIEDPTKFYRGIVAVEELKEENEKLKEETKWYNREDVQAEIDRNCELTKENIQLQKENENLKEDIVRLEQNQEK
jgi:uncharacterized protein YlxW (UPF0749 family)